MTVRILLADDQALLRSTFRLLIESQPDLEVVGEASDGAQAVSMTRSTRADVVLMDVRMPGVDGIEATRRITADEDLAGTRILVLTTFETDDLVIAALRAGASGYLGKGVQPEVLLAALRTTAAGEQLLSPAATTALIARVVAEPEVPTAAGREPVAELTAREREVTAWVGRGLSNDEIGRELWISTATVKTHVNRAMMKTDSRDRAQLVIYAYETGLVRPGQD